jgi:arylsulfatase A-like enzyme
MASGDAARFHILRRVLVAGVLLLLVAAAVEGEEPLRLLDSPGMINGRREAPRPVSGRTTVLAFEASELQTVFCRGLTLRQGESAVWELPRATSRGGVLRWLEGVAADSAGGGALARALAVSVDGVEIPPRVTGAFARSLDVPVGARELRFRSRAEPAVRFGEPILLFAADDPQQRSPDILLITVDTLRRDALSIYGGPESAMPGLDRLAREAIVFTDVIAPSSWTIPSFVGLFTGRHPLALGATGRDVVISRETPLLAELLRDRGYHTLAVAQNTMLAPDGGFARGFDVYDFFAATEETLRTADETTESALAWSRSVPAAPLFLWVHYFDPHSQYRPAPEDARLFAPAAGEALDRFRVIAPEDSAQLAALRRAPPEKKDWIRALYLGEVRAVDRAIAHLLAEWRARGRLENTLVIVTSDHGEEFLEHGALGHGHTVYDELLRVPLLMRFPQGRGADRRVRGQVTLLDLLPTILEVAGGAAGEAPSLAGRSLAPALQVTRIEPRPEIAVAGLYPELAGSLLCVRNGSLKVVFREAAQGLELVEAYDLSLDPREGAPLARPPAEDLARARQTIAAQLSGRALVPAESLTVEQRERLRSLGYLH